MLQRCAGKYLRLAALAGAALVVYSAPASADQVFSTLPGQLVNGLPVNATADFTLGNGSITIVLSNFQGNPTSVAQLIAGVIFDVSDASGSGMLTTANSGNISTINTSTGAYTAGVADSLTRWEANESGSTIDLNIFSGGPPDRLIIGPDDMGNFNPALGGLYSAANASINTHNPSVLGTGTFVITVPGVLETSQLSNVRIYFNTDGTTVPTTSVVPEPSSVVLASTGIVLALGLTFRRRRLAA